MSEVPKVSEATVVTAQVQRDRELVREFAKSVGLRDVVWGSGVTPLGSAYAGLTSAVKEIMSPEGAVHDTAHFILAPRSRKHRANFGLGAAPPSFGETRHVKARVGQKQAGREEMVALVLHMLIARAMFGVERVMELYRVDMEERLTYFSTFMDFWQAKAELERRGLIDSEGNLLLPLPSL